MKKLALDALEVLAVLTAVCLFALLVMGPMEKTVISCHVLQACG